MLDCKSSGMWTEIFTIDTRQSTSSSILMINSEINNMTTQLAYMRNVIEEYEDTTSKTILNRKWGFFRLIVFLCSKNKNRVL